MSALASVPVARRALARTLRSVSRWADPETNDTPRVLLGHLRALYAWQKLAPCWGLRPDVVPEDLEVLTAGLVRSWCGGTLVDPVPTWDELLKMWTAARSAAREGRQLVDHEVTT